MQVNTTRLRLLNYQATDQPKKRATTKVLLRKVNSFALNNIRKRNEKEKNITKNHEPPSTVVEQLTTARVIPTLRVPRVALGQKHITPR